MMGQLAVGVLAILFVVIGPQAYAADYLCKQVGREWVWFSDHAAMSVDYLVIGEAGRKYEVGTGIFFNSRPLGSKNTHSGRAEIVAYGIGALHIRQADGGPPFKICGTASKLEAITILRAEF